MVMQCIAPARTHCIPVHAHHQRQNPIPAARFSSVPVVVSDVSEAASKHSERYQQNIAWIH